MYFAQSIHEAQKQAKKQSRSNSIHNKDLIVIFDLQPVYLNVV